MRKLRVTVAAIAFVIQSPSIAAAGWVKVVSDAHGVIFVNTAQMHKNRQQVAVWIKEYPVKSESNGASYEMSQERFDCNNETRTLMNFITYSSDGMILENFNYAGGYVAEPVIPDSAGKRIFDLVCQPSPKSVP